MKVQLALCALAASLITAAPTELETRSTIERRAGPIFDLSSLKSLGLTDTANEWSKITSKATCPPVAAIFARGTFDSGNIGVFVGPEIGSFLKKKIPGLSYQGVDSSKYPATLMDYLKKGGGSDDGATSMASQAAAVVKTCGDKTAIVLIGWSQGAIVTRKALGIIFKSHPETLKQVAGMGTFGDPHEAWEAAGAKIPFPPGFTNVNSLCVTGLPNVDFLCAPFDSKGYKIPTSPKEFINPWGAPKDVEAVFKGGAQAANGVKVLKHLTTELTPIVGSGAIWPLMKVVISTHPTRAMLRPAHFTYGDNGLAEKMAEWISTLPLVKAKMGAHKV